MASSLRQLLSAPAGEVAAWGLTHQVTLPTASGRGRPTDLLPAGASVPVTGANRRAFAGRYATALLHSSVARQAQAFAAGFQQVSSGCHL